MTGTARRWAHHYADLARSGGTRDLTVAECWTYARVYAETARIEAGYVAGEGA